jgi:hypothetical protein
MLAAGTALGPYKVLAPLGAGGMGEVYRARDTRLDRDVALKVLPERVAGDPKALARFEREAKAVAALSHPNILAVHDYGREDGTAYVVTELLDGETLRAALAGGPLPVRKAVDYAVQAAHGLAAAHEKGIVHRDVKPENLFITRDGRVKVLDFGLAAHEAVVGTDATSAPTLSRHTDPGVVLGTVPYMSPEQVRGTHADHRSDIFALGCVLYEMLAGRRAFQRETAAETMAAILKDDVPEWPETGRQVPPALDRLLRRCLEKRPEERLQSARDLALALEALTVGDTSGAALPPRVAGAGRGRLLRVAGLLLVGAGLGYLAAEIAGAKAARPAAELPAYTHLTFRRGWVPGARFAPDGRSVTYSATWDSAPLRVYSVRPDNPTAVEAPVAEAHLYAVSREGELALCLRPWTTDSFVLHGMLARLRPGGGAPREVLEDVSGADWSPRGELAVVRHRGGHTILEFPIGEVLYQSPGWISSPRFSPGGERLAFLEHPIHGDDRGWPAVVDLASRAKRDLAPEFDSLSGLAWWPDGREVCFGNVETIRCLGLAGPPGSRVLTRGAPQYLILHDISSEGRLLVTAFSWSGSLMVAADGGPERDLSRLTITIPIDFSRDGRHLLFSEGQDYGIHLVSLDGGPPVRLGDGIPTALSPDDRWVLAIAPQSPTQLVLLPTGPGSRKLLPRGALSRHFEAVWMPDGRRVVVSGAEPGRAPRLFLQDVAAGEPRPLSTEGLRLVPWVARAVSLDGRQVLAQDAEQHPVLVPLDGGPPRPLPGFGDDLVPVGWAGDARTVYARPRFLARRWPIEKIDVLTGRHEHWKTIGPADPTGTPRVACVEVSEDGRSYAYRLSQILSDLCVVSGVPGAPSAAPGPRP